jgi:hypothetical protein
MSTDEYLRLPVMYKRWMIQRINTEIKRASEQGNDIPSKGVHDNAPDARAFSGKFKQFGAHGNQQRFT